LRHHANGSPVVIARHEEDEAARLARGRRHLTPEASLPHLRQLQRAVGEMARAQIIAALRGGPLAAGDLARLIGRPGPATSQHLAILREIGVVVGQRRRSRVYYELRPGRTTDRALRVLADVEDGGVSPGDAPSAAEARPRGDAPEPAG
jgi:DNA-binding transcriptional ArsR family regulator